MCGIGKTTLVKEVARLARQDNLFDHDEKKILIVLDNVWKHVYLDTVGIPFRDDHKDIVVYYSLSMGSKDDFLSGVLNEEEAWRLFK
ncbi:hypothetical protein CUMW_278750, partial [Citrus unshiu]